MSLGWGLVGIGVLADVSIAPAVTALDGSHLAAVCSRSSERAAVFGAKHGAIASYDDYANMLADPAVDIVYIASPNGLHADQTVAALKSGKHVLVEKPMALTTSDAKAMVRAAESADRLLGVGFHLRHKETARAGRRAINDGRIGDAFYAEMALGAGKGLYPYDTWRADQALAGGGTLLHQGTHAIDLAAFLFDSPVVEVTAMMDAAGAEDVFVGSCRLANGELVNMASHSRRPGTRGDWTVFGTAGWLDARGGTTPGAGDSLNLHTDEVECLATSPTSAYVAEIAAFADAAAGRAGLSGSGSDGLHVVAVSEALYRAAAERRTVAVESGF